MAVIKKDGNFMGLPMNVARGNPIPLDKSEIWYSYAEMETYAKTDPVAYVGQILGLVNEQAKTATAYIILNTAGDLQEIGASVDIPSLMGDNSSVIISNDIVALKNWGVQYYKYIAATDEEEAHYIIQVVDDAHPWVAGLEPKATLEEGQIVLGWYEPNPTTIEGVNSQLGTLQTTVNDLKQNTYTKAEVDKKVAEAGHLKRVIINSIDDIDVDAENADQFIYMVLVSPEDTADKYDEYMVIAFEDEDGNVVKYAEKVGSWEVDLSNYVTNEFLTQELAKKVNSKDGYSLVPDEYISKIEGIEAGAQKNLINAVESAHFEVDENGLLTFKGVDVSKINGLTSLLDGKVDKEEGKGLSSNDFTDDHKNAIAANTQNIQTLDGKLVTIHDVLNGVEGESEGLIKIVSDLSVLTQTHSDTLETYGNDITGLKSTVQSHTETLVTVNNKITGFEEQLATIKLSDYVTKALFETTVGNIEELQAGQVTLHSQVKEIQEALAWGQLEDIIN